VLTERGQWRTLYNLQTHQSLSWNLSDSSASCGHGSFSGDWGDPFADSAGPPDDPNTKQVGTETLHGYEAKVFEAPTPNGKLKVWLEPKLHLILKYQMIPAKGEPQTMLEVTELSLSAPPASIFAPPASCAAASSEPPILSEEERIAAETGSNGRDFARAIVGPSSPNSCTVLLRVVRAGSMEPVVSGFQVALDLTGQKPGGYNISVNLQGHATFSGGGVRDMTPQLHNGMLRIDNAPAQFDVETYFGNGGEGSALIYRQCAGPQTVLLYVVKNPDKLTDGAEWLWVKSGKYATP